MKHSEHKLAFQLNLQTEPIGRISADNPVCIERSSSVRSAIEAMRTHSVGNVLICEGEKLVGILTERDVLKLMAEQADFDVSVDKVMTSEPVTLSKNDSVGQAIQLMAGGGYRRIPVVDAENVPTAILRAADVLHYLVEHFPEYIYNLPPAPHHTTQEREGA